MSAVGRALHRPVRAGPGLAWRWFGLALLVALLMPRPVRAQDLLPVPTLTARVLDAGATLSAAQRSALEAKLEALERETGTQTVIVLVPSTKPEDIADYTQRLGDAWRIGRPQVGDGLLVVVAVQDRRVRIAPAKSLEGAIPDLAARQIIDRQIAPAFRAGDYAGGLNAAIDALGARIRAEQLPAPERGTVAATGSASDGASGWQDLAIFFFVGVPIFGAVLTGVLGRRLGALATGGVAGGIGWGLTANAALAVAAGVVALVLVGVLGFGATQRRSGFGGGRRMGPRVGGPVIFPGGGWGGGSSGSGGFSGGGGGFSSGGGGDFGGGGASGDW